MPSTSTILIQLWMVVFACGVMVVPGFLCGVAMESIEMIVCMHIGAQTLDRAPLAVLFFCVFLDITTSLLLAFKLRGKRGMMLQFLTSTPLLFISEIAIIVFVFRWSTPWTRIAAALGLILSMAICMWNIVLCRWRDVGALLAKLDSPPEELEKIPQNSWLQFLVKNFIIAVSLSFTLYIPAATIQLGSSFTVLMILSFLVNPTLQGYITVWSSSIFTHDDTFIDALIYCMVQFPVKILRFAKAGGPRDTSFWVLNLSMCCIDRTLPRICRFILVVGGQISQNIKNRKVGDLGDEEVAPDIEGGSKAQTKDAASASKIILTVENAAPEERVIQRSATHINLQIAPSADLERQSKSLSLLQDASMIKSAKANIAHKAITTISKTYEEIRNNYTLASYISTISGAWFMMLVRDGLRACSREDVGIVAGATLGVELVSETLLVYIENVKGGTPYGTLPYPKLPIDYFGIFSQYCSYRLAAYAGYNAIQAIFCGISMLLIEVLVAQNIGDQHFDRAPLAVLFFCVFLDLGTSSLLTYKLSGYRGMIKQLISCTPFFLLSELTIIATVFYWSNRWTRFAAALGLILSIAVYIGIWNIVLCKWRDLGKLLALVDKPEESPDQVLPYTWFQYFTTVFTVAVSLSFTLYIPAATVQFGSHFNVLMILNFIVNPILQGYITLWSSSIFAQDDTFIDVEIFCMVQFPVKILRFAQSNGPRDLPFWALNLSMCLVDRLLPRVCQFIFVVGRKVSENMKMRRAVTRRIVPLPSDIEEETAEVEPSIVSRGPERNFTVTPTDEDMRKPIDPDSHAVKTTLPKAGFANVKTDVERTAGIKSAKTIVQNAVKNISKTYEEARNNFTLASYMSTISAAVFMALVSDELRSCSREDVGILAGATLGVELVSETFFVYIEHIKGSTPYGTFSSPRRVIDYAGMLFQYCAIWLSAYAGYNGVFSAS
ncbi:hypothetical protein HDU97_005177 [Phlyctochytrium planicorne]|nr:hypothetical protein HDU97_005177 [Phlyctochytrium planicorne]